MKADRAVERNCKNPYLWLFYNFCREYARTPADLEDLLDGLSCIRARTEIEEIYSAKE